MSSLDEFASTYKPERPSRCWACQIPESEEINKGRRNGVAVRAIRAWLIHEKGYSADVATLGRLQGHFDSGKHHERS